VYALCAITVPPLLSAWHTPPARASRARFVGSARLEHCEGVGTLLSSIIPECKEVTKEDEIGRNQDDETISRMS
jgi:hypothetical protein